MQRTPAKSRRNLKTIPIPPALHNAIRKEADAVGMTMKDFLAALLAGWRTLTPPAKLNAIASRKR